MPLLRTRSSLSRAALALALALWVRPAAATDPTIGNSCTPQAGLSARYDNGNNTWCNGSTYQYPAYQFGNSTATCNSTNAGMMRYNNSASDVTSSLVAHWPLDASSGTTVADTSGNGYTGTIYGSNYTWLPSGGQIAGALDFTSNDTYVDFNNAIIADTDAFTITAWVNLPANGQLNISRGADGYGAGWSVGFSVGAGATSAAPGITIITTSGGAAQYSASSALSFPVNTWAFVAAVWSPGTSLGLYVNGQVSGLVPNSTSILRSSTIGMRLQAFNTTLVGPGELDDVRVYNRVLSSAEIFNLYLHSGGGAMQFCNGNAWETLNPFY